MRSKYLFVFLLSFIVCAFAHAQLSTTCPYESLKGKKSAELLDALHASIKNHSVLQYADIRADRADVDIVNGWVVDMYSDCDFGRKDYCDTGTDYGACDCYNREHALPKSWWGGSTSEPMYTDLHHILPTDFEANTKRSAWAYGEVSSAQWSNSAGCKLGTGYTYGNRSQTLFEPQNDFKGDLARIYFYMLTCYKDKNFQAGGKGYLMFTYNNGVAGLTSDGLKLLLKWHRADPVSARERDRNNRVAAKQGNRNPFVDAPDLVEYIWGTHKYDAYSCGETDLEEVEMIPLDCNLPMYNILGVPVGAGYRGLIIQNGRKYRGAF